MRCKAQPTTFDTSQTFQIMVNYFLKNPLWQVVYTQGNGSDGAKFA
jgi:hypothetical protein